MSSSTQNELVTAAMIAIGDELLSGRTKDKNIGYLAEKLTTIGVDLKEVRIIPDDEDMIVCVVNQLRKQYDYVFTSGGIGPTHDDRTAEAIAKAFSLPCIIDPSADRLLQAHYAKHNTDYTQARRLMARMPEGAQQIPNKLSIAPGFYVENVYVMAGVPSIFSTMLEAILPAIKKGRILKSVSILCPLGEGLIGTRLADIQNNNPQVMIGSYPHFKKGQASLELVVRGNDDKDIDHARNDIETMIRELLNDNKNFSE